MLFRYYFKKLQHFAQIFYFNNLLAIAWGRTIDITWISNKSCMFSHILILLHNLLKAPIGHWCSGSITALTFCESGLVSASEDCTICIWDVNTGAIIRKFDHQKGKIYISACFVISPVSFRRLESVCFAHFSYTKNTLLSEHEMSNVHDVAQYPASAVITAAKRGLCILNYYWKA